MKAGNLLALTSIAVLTASAAGCNDPVLVNIGDSPAKEVVNSILGAIKAPFLWLPLVETLIGFLVTEFETPIQFRFAGYQGMNVYNAIAMYHPTALDIWGRGYNRICVDQFSSEEEKLAHEQLTSAYAFAYSAIKLVPQITEAISNIMDNVLGLPMSNILDGSPDIGTPWGLAKVAVEEMSDYIVSDGWNADGSQSNEFNKMPYSDFTFEDAEGNEYSRYETKVNDFEFEDRDGRDKRCEKIPDPWFWEPLLESNNFGYFTRQEHVIPFCGFTGRLYGLSEEEYESFSSPLPDYDYCYESEFVLQNTKELATSDALKMEVEFFDNKFTSLLPLQINWALQNGLSQFDFWYYDMTLVTSMYDAVILVWRDKVLFNLVRPTTVVHAIEGETEVDTYAGPFQGNRTIKAKDWQPYFRTMPHAEYPSGSSCICTAFAEVLQELTGNDATGIPLTMEFPKGSSKIEPGMTPKEDTKFTYNKWSEVQQVCGASREAGGMHFSQAVGAGEELCSGVAALVVNRAELLKMGDPTGAMADFNDRDIHVKTKTY